MSGFLYLRRSDLESLVGMDEALKYAEHGFELHGKSTKGLVQASFSPMVAFHTATPNSDIDYRAGAIDPIPALCSVFGFGYADNPAKHGLPSVFAFAILTDIETGVPLAIMDGYFLSYVRTGAAAAVASKYLAKKDPSAISFIGTGNLARFTLRAHLAQYGEVDRIKAWSRTAASAQKFASDMHSELGVDVTTASHPKEAVGDSDVVYCTTRSRQPLVMNDWVKPGMHISAFGADAPGKQELDPTILARAKVVVDSLEQCKSGGEIRDALTRGIIRERDIHAELGEIVNGWKKGRETEEEITVVDSTGIAALDIVIYYRVYQRALEEGKGIRLGLD